MDFSKERGGKFEIETNYKYQTSTDFNAEIDRSVISTSNSTSQKITLNNVGATGKTVKPGMEYMSERKTEHSYYIRSLLVYTQLMSILYISSYGIYSQFGPSFQIGNLSALIIYGTQCSMIALGIQSIDFIYYQSYFQVIYSIVFPNLTIFRFNHLKFWE